MQNNLSAISQSKLLSPIVNNNSFRRLGNSIIAPGSINSFTVNKITTANNFLSPRDQQIIQSRDQSFQSRDPFYPSYNQALVSREQPYTSKSLHMSKDQSIAPRGDQSIAPRWDQSIAPRGDQSITPRGDQSIAPRGDQSIVLRGDQSIASRGDQQFNIKEQSYMSASRNQPVKSRSQRSLHENQSYISNTRGNISRETGNNSRNPESAKPAPPQKSQTSEKNSIKYLKRDIQATYPPGDYKYSIFAIYEDGNSYDNRKRSYGMPKGMGVLLNEHLCLTAASIFTDEASVIKSFMQLKDGSIFRFDPYRAFVIVQEQFAIIGFHIKESKVLEKFKPVDITAPFELTENDPVFYFPLDTNKAKTVLVISPESFTISSGRYEYILPGNPIFTIDWKLQGIFIKSDGHINNVLKIKPIFEYLESSIPLFHNPILEKLINQDTPGYVEKFHDRFLYYFEWGTCKIWRYDIDKTQWNEVKIHNFDTFSEEEESLWSFGENSRLLYLPNGSIVCLGGVSKTASIELREVYEFSPQEYHNIRRLSDMLVPRNGLSCVYIDNYIYVMGGLPNPQTCEKYSIISQVWLPLSSMYYPRTNSTATSALGAEFIFIVGGEPLSPSGTSIEKYSIKFNHWELLSIYLPKPMAKIGLFPITNRRIAIFGGTDSNHVFIFNINDILQINSVDYSTQNERQCYTLQDCLRSLENITETVFPVAFSRTHNILYIMNSYKSDASSLSFSIEEFSVEYFEISSHVDFTHKPAEVIAKVRTPYELGRSWKNDSKLRMIK